MLLSLHPPPRGDDDLRIAILAAVGQNSGPFSGIGRGQLIEKLSEEGILIGEGILKRHLAELKQDGLIFSGSGRSGSRITEKGKELLKNKE